MLSLAGVVAMIWLATQQPWLGLTLRAAEDGLSVARVSADVPVADQLRPGTRLSALVGDGEMPVALEAGDVLEEPDFHQNYDDYNRFIERQGRLRAQLSAERLTLVLTDGRRVSVTPFKYRPVASLPVAFWFQLAFGVSCLAIGAAVCAYRRNRPALLFATTGMGLFLVGLTAAVYSTRELALTSTLFRVLAILNHGGGMLFGAALIGLLLHYPTSLTRRPLVPLVLAAFMGIWVLDVLQWMPSVDAGFRYPLVAALLITFALAVLQRRRLTQPGDRIAFRWFVFPLFVGATLFQAITFLPLMTGQPPLLPQSYSFGLLLLVYAGMAVGVARYGLFQLQRLWYPALAGSASLLIGLALMPLLARFAGLSQTGTLIATLALLGWLYFPLRDMVRARRVRHLRHRVAPILGQGMRFLLDPKAEANRDVLWAALLQQVFRPVDVQPCAAAGGEPEITDDGSTLIMPATPQLPAMSIQWPDGGSRLFETADLQLAQTLMPLAQHGWDVRAAWEAGVRAERKRIRTDLEDDLSNRIFMQILKAPDQLSADAQRAALAEVRLVVDQLSEARRSLAECLEEWKSQVADYCDLADVTLRWRQTGDLPDEALSAMARANPLRILREALANAIQHGHPTYIEVAVHVAFPQIRLTLLHDGAASTPETWSFGRGLRNIQARVRQLAGRIDWTDTGRGGVRMACDLNLAAEEQHG
ncbi:MAG: hypothetical protein CMN28_09615 [Salinisphaeraceae bacterium]|nr:hypothetical protein [Salinisphaeraceae bacterium]